MPVGRPASPGSVGGVHRRTRRRTRRRTAVVVGGAAATAGYVAGKSGNKSDDQPHDQQAQAPADEKTPKQILDERLAKGEITAEEHAKAVAELG